MTTIEHKADATDVEASFAACSEDVRSRARNFWYGLRLLPPDRFRALCAIYSWMRRADDIADEDAPGVTVEVRRRVLDEFRARTSELFSGSLTRELPPEEAHLWVAMEISRPSTPKVICAASSRRQRNCLKLMRFPEE